MVAPKAFSHVGLRADDVDDTVRSLEALLGVDCEDRGRIENEDWERDVEYAALGLADKAMFVVRPTPYEAAGVVDHVEPGIAHYGVEVDDVEAALEDWSESEVLMKPFALGDTRYAFCNGPDGTRIELVEP